MIARMSQISPEVTDAATTVSSSDAPRVRVLITWVADADLEAALAVVGRQVYEPAPDVLVVGEGLDVGPDVATATSLEEAISSTDPSVDYLWLLHADARPRPDALAALVAEIERNEASLAGSKLLKAGTMDELESVGGATDVFGEPYSGLDEGEIDLQQYDVVREVAFVQSASMLIRRDLAQGLRGLDPLLPPVAAGLDFSQRTRLAGGRVISVPSSEVYHQARCGQRGEGWREQAGRLRAMLIAYSPLTLLWIIPYDILVGVLDSIGSLLLLRWRPLARHLFSWAWNLYHVPSTISQRRRLRSVRSESDEELFRFHAKGSIRLRAVGEELSGRALSLFDEDQALSRSTRRLWGSPGIWGAVLAGVVALVGARDILLTGMPNIGFAFPFEPPTIALERWMGGWNDSGLGSAAQVHPSVGLTGVVSSLWFGAEGAARTLMTVALSFVGVVGMGRLAGRIGLRGPGRYLAGLVLMAGPGTAVLTQSGSWLALAAAATLPWAARSVYRHPHEEGKSRLSFHGWALLTGMLVAAFSPTLALVPLLTVVIWKLLGGRGAGVLLGVTVAVGGSVGAGFLIGDPGWLTDGARSLGLSAEVLWPVLVVVGAGSMVSSEGPLRTLALTGGILSLVGMAALRSPGFGPGVEEGLLVLASFGAGLVVAAGLDHFSRRATRLVAAGASIGILLISLTAVGNGRLGLPEGDINERLSFARALADGEDPGRILHASLDPVSLPGEVRPGPGYWYRVLDGAGTTHDEIWLPEAQGGDSELDAALTEISAGAELRPGQRLASFGIEWVVLEGPSFLLDEVLVTQLDLVPTPFDPEARVFENHGSFAIAQSAEGPWVRAGTGFAGVSTDSEVRLAVNFDDGWQPDARADDWAVSVIGVSGEASYSPSTLHMSLAIGTAALALVALLLIALGRRRS